MAERKFQDIWKEQCVAARSLRAQHGILSALDYLIGEKLLIYAKTAVTRREFARELPAFRCQGPRAVQWRRDRTLPQSS
jgi:hypothetical protein